MSQLNALDNSYLIVEGDSITSFGTMDQLPCEQIAHDARMIDATGRVVMPTYCDSHTHLVYASSREGEFVDRIRGLSYEQIARRGGGILNSAARLHDTSEQELYDQALERIEAIIATGTGAVEIKSGYGLTTKDELKMLRVIRRLRETTPIEIRSTLLAAHAFPLKYKGREDEYVDLIVDEMLPLAADEGLIDYIDAFCDKGFFSVAQTERLLTAAQRYGIRGKIHANEMAISGGVQLGVRSGCLSVDHLECMGRDEIDALAGADTMPTLLPGAAFFLGLSYPPAREMIDSGLGVALASDFNPGSSPSGDMRFVVSLACIRMKMLPSEAINAATLNSAYAMGISHSHGSIAVGKRANLIITRPIPSVDYIPYAYTSSLAEMVIINGQL